VDEGAYGDMAPAEGRGVKRDTLRTYLAMARECYDLAATPQPTGLYRQCVDEIAGAEDYRMPTDVRMTLLQISLDVRLILATHLAELEASHGDGRAKRLLEWIHDGRIDHLTYWKRMELFADRKRLKMKISAYRGRR